MKTPTNAIIPDEKLTHYLLVPQVRNDKSKFLARVGFTLDNPAALKVAIELLVEKAEAVAGRASEYGVIYAATGTLEGPNGVKLEVNTVWMQRYADDTFRYVTLTPKKG